MLKTIIPKSRYWLTDYPNLEDGADGRVRPLFYGTKENIRPVCLNTSTGLYEIANHGIKEITEIKAGEDTLVVDEDYTEDLANGQFQFSSTPKITGGTTYYAVIEADNVINGTDYIKVLRRTDDHYASGQCYTIDGSDTWTAQAYDLCLRIWATKDLAQNGTWIVFLPNTWTNIGRVDLRADASVSRIAQSFQLPAWAAAEGDWYIILVELNLLLEGSPTGTLYYRILSDNSPETQLGVKSDLIDGGIENIPYAPLVNGTRRNRCWFPKRASLDSDVFVTAKGKYSADAGNPLITTMADMVEDIMTDELEVSSDALDGIAFSKLKAHKTEEVSCYLNTEIPFGRFLSIAEDGQDWKLIPKLDRTYSPQWYDPDLPSGEEILHLRDEDFVSFYMYRDLEAVKQICIMRYDHSPSGSETEVFESTNFYPLFFFSNEETIELDAFLKDSTEVGLIAVDKLERVEDPLLMAVFETKGHGFDLLPMDRVYLTRKRALYSGGEMDKVLFRILKIQKKVSSKTTEITAVLDSQVSI